MKKLKNIYQDIKTAYSKDQTEFNDILLGGVGVIAIFFTLYIAMIAVNG